MTSSSSSHASATIPKPNPLKRKIEIKKVGKANKANDMTFSKRKLGLFNKVTELSILCQVDAALIITSENDKHFYTCGYPDPDTVVQRYLARETTPEQHVVIEKRQQDESIETLRLQYEASLNQLQEEKQKLLEAITKSKAQKTSLSFPSWWDQSIEQMGLEDLETFKTSLENLKLNLIATAEATRYNAISPMAPPPQQLSDLQILGNNGYGPQVHHWDGRRF